MDAYDRSSAIEHATMTRVAEIYAGALRQALKDKKAFLQKVKDVENGKIKPPKYYVDTDQVDKWKQGFLRELIRQNAVIDGIMKELNKAGVEAAELIRGSMVDIYQANREEAVSVISEASGGISVQGSFATYNKKQIDVLVEEGQSPFSRLAYQNMGQNPVIRRRLQNELGMAAILGESQSDLIKRIRKVTGQTVAQARRVAQTERTRVQSQARWQTGQEAAAMGLTIVNEWSTRMVNSRDSHAALDGEKKPQGEPFHTIWGNDLLYPGDPSAPAREVINCHCVLVPDVVVDESEKTDIKAAERFIPAKTIEEAEEYGKRFVVQKTWTGNGNVSYKGMTLDAANSFNATLDDLYKRFNLPQLYNIQPMNFRKNLWKSSENAPMAYRDLQQGELYFNPKLMKSKKALDGYFAKGNEAYDICQKNFHKFTGRQRDMVERYLQAGRSLVADDAQDKFRAVVQHEIGHLVQHRILYRNKDVAQEALKNADKFGVLISGYATATNGEYMAESFCAYVNNESERIDPVLKNFFEGLIK